MFYNMVNKCIMTQWQKFPIFWQQAGHVEIHIVLINATSRSCRNTHCSYQRYQPGKITLQISVLMIENLVAMSYD